MTGTDDSSVCCGDTQVLCTYNAISTTAFCRLVALVVDAVPQSHLELMASDVIGMIRRGEERSLLVFVGCAFATPARDEAVNSFSLSPGASQLHCNIFQSLVLTKISIGDFLEHITRNRNAR